MLAIILKSFLIVFVSCGPYVPCPNNEYITLGFEKRTKSIRFLKVTKILKNTNVKVDSLYLDMQVAKTGSSLNNDVLKVNNLYDYDYLLVDTLNKLIDTINNISYKKLQFECKQNPQFQAIQINDFNFRINKKEYINYEKFEQKIIFLDK